jgi:hypothetical protein
MFKRPPARIYPAKRKPPPADAIADLYARGVVLPGTALLDAGGLRGGANL